MNFLAHAYLSFNQPEILAGNMISDFVKGKAQYNYSPIIQAGIRLHRSIDAFTDTHPATKKAQTVFQPHYRLYSGPLVDVLYDHYLAKDGAIFPADGLERFSESVYLQLEAQSAQLPPRFLQVFTYMKEQNWLLNYRTLEGSERSLQGLVRRCAYTNDAATAISLFRENYEFLQACYNSFIQDVKNHAQEELVYLLL
ncbi:MAG: ACP phosphodiesterase [Chitinophagaceae bacterium]